MKILRITLNVLLATLFLIVCVVGFIYRTHLRTAAAVERVSFYNAEFNLYRMNVKYEYDLDKIVESGIGDDQRYIDAILEQAVPYCPVQVETPNFDCSAFSVKTNGGDVLTGRNYDFNNDTSAILVCSAPSNGYRSVAVAALDNLTANQPDKSIKARIASLAAPFVCLDGMNEKGVSIAALTLDSDPTRQNNGKPTITTTLAVRLVLDRAATTQEAVELLEKYDMFASGERDYHFYIADASGDGRVVEYDCLDEKRPLVATPARTVTNFFELYRDKTEPNQANGVFGHGRERYDAIEAILTANEEKTTSEIAWQALQSAAQKPIPDEITNNTQWSVVYDNSKKTAEIALHRDWDVVFKYNLQLNDVAKK